jgi:uncharacterized protein (TIGR02246 family)
MKRTLALITLAAALALPAPGQDKAAAGGRHGAQQVDEAMARAFKANDVNAIVALYAPDAVLYPPGSMEQRGQQAIRAGFAAFLEHYRITDFAVVNADYATAGDVSSGWGRFVLSATPRAGGAPVRWEGRFSNVARRIKGTWLYVSDHASMPTGPPPGVPKPASAPGR